MNNQVPTLAYMTYSCDDRRNTLKPAIQQQGEGGDVSPSEFAQLFERMKYPHPHPAATLRQMNNQVPTLAYMTYSCDDRRNTLKPAIQQQGEGGDVSPSEFA